MTQDKEKKQQRQLNNNHKIKERAEELRKEVGIRKIKSYKEILRERAISDKSYQCYLKKN